MNPFDFYGPQFLVFYLILGAVVISASVYLRRQAESGIPTKTEFSDPYLLAYLRGGPNESSRVAVVSLIDRGLLKVQKTSKKNVTDLVVEKHVTADIARRPIEKALLKKFETSKTATSIFGDDDLEYACEEYKKQLTQLGFLPDEAKKAARRQRFLIGAAILLSVAAIKIMIALSRGRYNILFLIMLAILFPICLYRISNPLRTTRGDRMLNDLRTLFSSLKKRGKSIKPGGETSELALLMSVFGLGALSTREFPYAKTLYPKATSSSSSCGASCGSACGSSCGGGGCGGGGCGGCGG